MKKVEIVIVVIAILIVVISGTSAGLPYQSFRLHLMTVIINKLLMTVMM